MALERTGVKHPDMALLDQSSNVDPKTAGQHWLREWEAARKEALGKTKVVEVGGRNAFLETQQALRSLDRTNIRHEAENKAGRISIAYESSDKEALHVAMLQATGAPTSASIVAVLKALSAIAPNTAYRDLEVAGTEQLRTGLAAEEKFEVAPKWDAENLHIQTMSDGVAVWLRDSNISAIEIKSVLQRLEQQLANAGLKLYQFHVNGKPIFSGKEQPQNDQS